MVAPGSQGSAVRADRLAQYVQGLASCTRGEVLGALLRTGGESLKVYPSVCAP